VNYLFILFFDIVNHMLWLPEENLQDSPKYKPEIHCTMLECHKP